MDKEATKRSDKVNISSSQVNDGALSPVKNNGSCFSPAPAMLTGGEVHYSEVSQGSKEESMLRRACSPRCSLVIAKPARSTSHQDCSSGYHWVDTFNAFLTYTVRVQV